jgi:hypothetical protein
MGQRLVGPGNEPLAKKSAAGEDQTQPTSSGAYVSFLLSREADELSGRGLRPVLSSALLGFAPAAAVVLSVALALMWSDLAGFLSAAALFAAIRHAQFRRARRKLARGGRV